MCSVTAALCSFYSAEKLRQPQAPVTQQLPAAVETPATPVEEALLLPQAKAKKASPLVGVVYLSPSPRKTSLVSVGYTARKANVIVSNEGDE